MPAFDHFRGAIVAPDAFHQLKIMLAGVLGDKDVAGAAKIARPFPQRAPGQQEFVSERSLSIYEHHVQAMLEVQILKSIIEQQRIDLPFIDGEPSAFGAVFVYQHDYVLQVVREHVRLVTGDPRVEQQGFAIRDNAWRIGVSAKPVQPTALARHALVTAREDGHAPPTCLQGAGKLLNNRSLTCAADGKVADTDDQTTKRSFAEEPFAIKI